MSLSRLSLVASFDDLTRNTAVLTAGIESEFIQFVQNQEECRQKWLAAESFIGDLQRKMKDIEAQNSALETKLKHARSQLNIEMDRRTKAEQQKEVLERQIDIIKELLNDKHKNNKSVLNDEDREKLAFLSMSHHSAHGETPKRGMDTIMESSASILSPSDISYDKTEDDLETSYLRNGRKWKRPSAPPMEQLTPPKRTRSGDRLDTSSRKKRRSLNVPKDGPIEGSSEVASHGSKKEQRRRSSRRPRRSGHATIQHSGDSDDSFWGVGSFASRNNNAATAAPPKGILKEIQQMETPTNTNNNAETPSLNRAGSASRLNRAHIFVSKTVMKPETCIPCGKRIKFGKPAMKCKDCRATCHPDCKDRVPLPCVPNAAGTPNAKVQAVIQDHVPSNPPYIPGILIHCVNEVESRGLTEVGIYRLSGSDKDVKDLRDKFLRNKGSPNLGAIQDIHVICGCIKDFLRNLKEPLVTYELWGDFVKAAEKQDPEESMASLYDSVGQLPFANRDSLAFMILHLQRVAECHECKMPATNLAKVFGPTIVGYSSAEPEPMQMITETKKQAMVLEKLMQIPGDFWTGFLTVDDVENMADTGLATPEPLQSMLGPVRTPGKGAESGGSISQRAKALFGKTPMTPRFGSIGKGKTPKRPTHFFSSPTLK